MRTMTPLSLGPILTLISSLCGILLLVPVAARDTSLRSLSAGRLEAMHRWESSARDRIGEDNVRRAIDASASPRVKNISFSNPKAASAYTGICQWSLRVVPSDDLTGFYVDGTTIPLVNFDAGPSWSGLIPVSSAANETRQV